MKLHLKTWQPRTVALLALAGIVYAFCVVSWGQHTGVFFDSEQYLKYGINLLDRGVFGTTPGVPDMNRESGYGIYLSALISLTRFLSLTNSELLNQPDQIFWLKVLQALVLFTSASICAFRGSFRANLRVPLFLLFIFSPSVIGAQREIYSEALTIPLSILLLYFLSRSLDHKNKWNYIGAGVAFGLLVLTKSYLQYLSWAFLLAAAIASLKKSGKTTLFLALAICGITAQSSWNLRNRIVFGDNLDEARLAIAVAGKVARIHQAHWSRDWPVALVASLGTNFCDKLFDESRCSMFDYRGCDFTGLTYVISYRKKFPTKHEADSAVLSEMKHLVWERPFSQVIGSALEIERMFFFESFLDSGTLPPLFQTPARAWHVVGSLILWALILVGLRSRRDSRTLGLFCLGLLAYHAVTMSQITNVVRYIFPMLPFLYYFAACGIAEIRERKNAA